MTDFMVVSGSAGIYMYRCGFAVNSFIGVSYWDVEACFGLQLRGRASSKIIEMAKNASFCSANLIGADVCDDGGGGTVGEQLRRAHHALCLTLFQSFRDKLAT